MEFSTSTITAGVFLALLAIALTFAGAASTTTTSGKRVLKTLRFATSTATSLSITIMTPATKPTDETFVDLKLGLCAHGLMHYESTYDDRVAFEAAKELEQDDSFGAATVMGLCPMAASTTIRSNNNCRDSDSDSASTASADSLDSFVIVIDAEEESEDEQEQETEEAAIAKVSLEQKQQEQRQSVSMTLLVKNEITTATTLEDNKAEAYPESDDDDIFASSDDADTTDDDDITEDSDSEAHVKDDKILSVDNAKEINFVHLDDADSEEEEAEVTADVAAAEADDSDDLPVEDDKTVLLVGDDAEGAELVNLDAAESEEKADDEVASIDAEVDDEERSFVEEVSEPIKQLVTPTDAGPDEAMLIDSATEDDTAARVDDDKTIVVEDECAPDQVKSEDAELTGRSEQQYHNTSAEKASAAKIEVEDENAGENDVEVQVKDVKAHETNIVRSLDQFDWNGNMHLILDDNDDESDDESEDESDDESDDENECEEEAPISHEVPQEEHIDSKSASTLEEIPLNIPDFVDPEDVLDRADCCVVQ